MKSFNAIFLGDAGCGKTTLINRYINNTFETRYTPTLSSKIKNVPAGKDFNLIVVDTPGQYTLNSSEFKVNEFKIDIGVIFYDVSSKLSYDNIDYWVKLYKNNYPNAPLIIAACKIDQQKVINNDQHFLLKRYTPYLIGISTKEDRNVCNLFYTILNIVNRSNL